MVIDSRCSTSSRSYIFHHELCKSNIGKNVRKSCTIQIPLGKPDLGHADRMPQRENIYTDLGHADHMPQRENIYMK